MANNEGKNNDHKRKNQNIIAGNDPHIPERGDLIADHYGRR
jgi:hypothetical protein